TGLAVVSVGHANPRVAAAVADQMQRLVHVSNLFYTEPMVALAERLTALSGLDRVFFANCGATANEAAIKLARRHG
ncbi:MAG: aminotransferase class III-fold pyridoxal phosphate-dependent enzyme, partial [Gemmatimonadetes bacterium]|nr:aminotransferase class III-fold pyridoxal phosphate-dependent enzyme [Gemmatimonadota bacterium]NIR34710.1 aminotransferase class III-fold pyridoxal phosphate-dependent enzyme [Actinomycetota bacterium]NIS28692.1 aminotransferase class III-fold pyridoxal phosphate-dependent enzyme [Actinomycetota bacterium]NIT94094.1 aminotransferase class III-fold pyridoxal phosphate-dependent enzyme [Actinomycetota bacterium]NIU64156.1 aminotransferase class III-fold pyridoxal phosphate-dependent enzyme [A